MLQYLRWWSIGSTAEKRLQASAHISGELKTKLNPGALNYNGRNRRRMTIILRKMHFEKWTLVL